VADSEFAHNLLRFGQALRRAGFDVPVDRVLALIDALALVDLSRRDEVFHTCRALLVSRHEQLEPFARLFAAFWRAVAPDRPRVAAVPPRRRHETSSAIQAASVVAGDAGGGPDDPAASGAMRAWSDTGGFATRDFAEFSAEELARARDALDRLAWTPGLRRTRRWERGRGARVDVRRALARSVRTGGDVFTLPTRRRRRKPRPLVLLCDVSGSMDRYSRLLLHFAHGLEQRFARVEAFVFSTRLTRVTRQLRIRRIDAALAAVSREVPDWSGGTRIGPAIEQFHRRWSRRVLTQGPVVLLISDGWDCGDPAVLGDQIARLQRSCHRLIWLNPLIGTEGYAPLTQGLQAALPYVDQFLPARTLADFADLRRALES
jgi:uncharacterized protein with von Willebrand factor type A (vWA) domain